MRTGCGNFVRVLLLATTGLFLGACPTTAPVTACDPSNDTPCFDGYACDPDARICRRACDDDGDCLGSESCDTVAGICKDGDRSGDSATAGDAPAGD